MGEGDRAQEQVLELAAERHWDHGYAVTAHGAQGASERFAITLEGVEGGREPLVNRASAYVALSRAKEHVQVYTDNEAGWLNAIGKAMLPRAQSNFRVPLVPLSPNESCTSLFLRHSRACSNVLQELANLRKRLNQNLPAYAVDYSPDQKIIKNRVP